MARVFKNIMKLKSPGISMSVIRDDYLNYYNIVTDLQLNYKNLKCICRLKFKWT